MLRHVIRWPVRTSHMIPWHQIRYCVVVHCNVCQNITYQVIALHNTPYHMILRSNQTYLELHDPLLHRITSQYKLLDHKLMHYDVANRDCNVVLYVTCAWNIAPCTVSYCIVRYVLYDNCRMGDGLCCTICHRLYKEYFIDDVSTRECIFHNLPYVLCA